MRRVLVTDFDGTMTRYDFYRLALARLVPAETPDFWEDYLAGRMTHFQALQAIFARIRGSEDDLLDTARAMEPGTDLHIAVTRLEDAGWEIVIASAGCAWYIERLLAERNVAVTLHANPGTYVPEAGLLMSLPVDSPYFTPTTGIDKVAVVRDAVESGACVAFAGDGKPDMPAALLVPSERRFARGWLADQFTADGVPFHPFAQWSEVAEMLLETRPC
jgi:HAD superfamily phosphoserine phosphatase-like hydrolase